MKHESKRMITSTYLGEIRGDVERIDSPRQYFLSNMYDLEQIVVMIKGNLKNSSDLEEVYNKLSPFQKVYLFRHGDILAAAGYNSLNYGETSLLLEVKEIALSQKFQDRDLFSLITRDALRSEKLILLRDSLRCPYLETLCKTAYSRNETPVEIKTALLEGSNQRIVKNLSENDRILVV